MKNKIATLIFKRKPKSMGQCEELAQSILNTIKEEKAKRSEAVQEALNPSIEEFKCKNGDCENIVDYTIQSILEEQQAVATINTCKVCFIKEEMLNNLDIGHIIRMVK